MVNDYRDFTEGDRKKVNGTAGGNNDRNPEVRSTVASTRPTREGLRREPSDVFIQRLGVATSRALERRLGRLPSKADVCGVVNTLTGSSSRFLRCAERAQARLAQLHAELQKSQEQQSGIDIAQELTASSIGSKRPLEEPDHNSSEPLREVKRARLESGNPNPPKSPPPPKPENAAPKHASVAPKETLPDPQVTPRVGSTSPHAGVDILVQTPVMAIEQPKSTNLNSCHEIEQRTQERTSHNIADSASQGNKGLNESTSRPTRRDSFPVAPTQTPAQEMPAMAPPLSAATPSLGAQQYPLTILVTQLQHIIGSGTDLSLNSPSLPIVAAAMGLPALIRPQAPPSAPALPLISNVPGIWAIQVGKPSPSQIDLSFEVDQDTAVCIRRWATRRQGFDPHVRHVVVHLVALQATAVSAAQKALSQSAGSMTPQAFALAVHDLQPQWPDDGTLVLQLNAGQPGEQSWFASDMLAGKSLDVSGAILTGTNSLRILQLRSMAEFVFALYAILPTSEMQAAAIEWERGRKMYSYRRPHSERLLA